MRFSLILLITILVSCAPIHRGVSVFKMSFEVGKEKKSSVGNNMVLMEACVDIHEEKWVGLAYGGYIKKDYRECEQRQELIYNGISKNTIRITYREYIKDMARPAFFQDLTYDLDQSSIIQFRSIKIQVIV